MSFEAKIIDTAAAAAAAAAASAAAGACAATAKWLRLTNFTLPFDRNHYKMNTLEHKNHLLVINGDFQI